MEKEESPRAMLEEQRKKEKKRRRRMRTRWRGDLEDRQRRRRRRSRRRRKKTRYIQSTQKKTGNQTLSEEPKEPTPVEEDVKPITAAPSKRHADTYADAPPQEVAQAQRWSSRVTPTRPVARALIGVSGAIQQQRHRRTCRLRRLNFKSWCTRATLPEQLRCRKRWPSLQ